MWKTIYLQGLAKNGNHEIKNLFMFMYLNSTAFHELNYQQ